MNQMVKAPAWFYALTMGVILFVGSYCGYEMTNNEWYKKLKAYAKAHPDETMTDFMYECEEDL